jgi:hypothetical protein
VDAGEHYCYEHYLVAFSFCAFLCGAQGLRTSELFLNVKVIEDVRGAHLHLPSLYHKAEIQMCHVDQVTPLLGESIVCQTQGVNLQPSLVRGMHIFPLCLHIFS